jgi:hypothetical protein
MKEPKKSQVKRLLQSSDFHMQKPKIKDQRKKVVANPPMLLKSPYNAKKIKANEK